MRMDMDAKDYKMSPSLQSHNQNNRIIHEYKMTEKNSKDAQQVSDSIMHNSSVSSHQNYQKSSNTFENRKFEMNEYDMWKYSYSLVKNGYSILAPEPSQRSRSYRDLILQEMNWMALDYYQERRWKSHIAKEISNSINTSIIDRKRLKRDWPSKQCSYNIEVFWMKLKETGEISGLSNALYEYCQRMVSGRTLCFNSIEVFEEVPVRRSDLLAITVPVYKNLNNNGINIAKDEVVGATLNHMLVLGAELYPQFHRPPDDEIDVFTLPALNPKHEFDYNTLLLMLHSLKSNMLPKMSKSEFKSMLASVGTYRTHHPQPGLSSILPVRRIPRDEIDPFSLSVNYRDFLDSLPIHPIHMQKLVLKWEDPVLNESDFELLDSWMLNTKCWPLISISLNLRSSSGGLLRRDFGPRTCRELFYKIKKTPRGLVNSSKKMLGPKQTKTILSFIDAPPSNFKFKLVVPPESLKISLASQNLKPDALNSPMKTLFGEVLRFYRDESKLYSMTQAGKKEGFYSILRLGADHKSDKRLLLKEVQSECTDAFVVPGNVKVEVLSMNSCLKLPVGLRELMIYDGNMESFIKRSDPKPDPEAAPNSQSRSRFVAFTKHHFAANHRFSSLNSVVTLATSLSSHDNVVRNLCYSELSTRMNKQLRIGFMGIPTKMFVYSLFYCGRIKPDFRVRRVALSISSITKFIPPPHLLYGKMFDTDINLILNKARALPYDKQRSKSVDSQDSFTTELVQNYSNEVSSYLKTKSEETNLPTILATYAHVSLSKGKACNQSCFSTRKIPVVTSTYGSSANTSNSSSTPTERKRPQVGSFESTPRQTSRQSTDAQVQPESLPSYRSRPEPVMRRQMPHPHGMMTVHPYQQMQMMYGINAAMNNVNQHMSGMNQQVTNMSQKVPAINQTVSGVNQQMAAANSISQPVNSMNQGMKQMNNINMMSMGQQINSMNNLNSGMNNMSSMNMSPAMNNMGMSQPMGGMNSMNQAMNNASQPMNSLNQGMSGMNQQVSPMNHQMASVPQQLAAMNQQITNMGQPISGMNQQLNSMSNMNNVNMNVPVNNMNNMSQPINNVNNMTQPVNKMAQINSLMNGKMMYNLQNASMQHYQEDESYQYRYDQQRQRHT